MDKERLTCTEIKTPFRRWSGNLEFGILLNGKRSCTNDFGWCEIVDVSCKSCQTKCSKALKWFDRR